MKNGCELGLKGLPAELAAIDEFPDDERFFDPYRAHFDPRWGRPSILLETYLRMMYLKHRRRLGYETLCRDVTDSITWRRFCRVGLGDSVPHSTTLLKITRRVGAGPVEELNRALRDKAREQTFDGEPQRVRAFLFPYLSCPSRSALCGWSLPFRSVMPSNRILWSSDRIHNLECGRTLVDPPHGQRKAPNIRRLGDAVPSTHTRRRGCDSSEGARRNARRLRYQGPLR